MYFYLFLKLIYLINPFVIQFSILIEKVEEDKTLHWVLTNLIENYNQKYFNKINVKFKLIETLFYNQYKNIEPELAFCSGSNNFNCRLKNIKNKNNVLMILSTPPAIKFDSKNGYTNEFNIDNNFNIENDFNIDNNFNIDNEFNNFNIENDNNNFNFNIKNDNNNFNIDNFISINPCKSRYFTNLYENKNLYEIISSSINDWISNLVQFKLEEPFVNENNENEFFDKDKFIKSIERCQIVFDDKTSLNNKIKNIMMKSYNENETISNIKKNEISNKIPNKKLELYKESMIEEKKKKDEPKLYKKFRLPEELDS